MIPGFLLDTNIPSELIRQKPSQTVERWFDLQIEETLFLSVATVGELRKGMSLLVPSKRRYSLEHWLDKRLIPQFEDRILPITQSIADRWGILAASLQRAGTPLAVIDGLIAATALEHGLTLVTRNLRDLHRTGVNLLNPWELEL